MFVRCLAVWAATFKVNQRHPHVSPLHSIASKAPTQQSLPNPQAHPKRSELRELSVSWQKKEREGLAWSNPPPPDFGERSTESSTTSLDLRWRLAARGSQVYAKGPTVLEATRDRGIAAVQVRTGRGGGGKFGTKGLLSGKGKCREVKTRVRRLKPRAVCR